MNKAFRLIWSHTRQAFVVADEHASAGGKRSAGRLLLAGAGLLALSGQVMASAPCANVLAGESRPNSCFLSAGDSVDIAATGGIVPAIGPAVYSYGTFGSVTNAGTITSNVVGVGIINSSGVLIDNKATGTISGTSSGIDIYGSSYVTRIDNAGTISGGAGILLEPDSEGVAGTPTIGELNNSGLITGNVAGIYAASGLIEGDLVNQASGTIAGDTAIILSGSEVTGAIRNSGHITGDVIGIQLSNSTVGSIVNAAGATISGALTGIQIDTGSTIQTIVNSGTISGGMGASIYADAETSLTSIQIDGNNTAKFQGTVSALNADMVLRQNATFTLLGNQVIAIDTFQNNGTLALGSTPYFQSATIYGDYSQSSTGTLQVNVNDASDYGKLLVNGTATLGSNAKIFVNVAIPGTPFDVSSLSGVLRATTLNSDGTFSVRDNSTLFNFGAVKNGNNIDLTLQAASQQPDEGSGGSSVEKIVRNLGNSPAGPAARVLDQAFAQNPQGALASHFIGLTSEQQVSDAVTQTLPLFTGGTASATSSTLSGINRVIQARQGSNSGLSSGDEPVAQDNLWIKTFGSWADQDERSGISGFDAQTQGLAIGVDGAFSEEARLGVAFAYANTNVDSSSHIAPQDAQIDTFQLIGYGSYALAPDTELNFQIDAGQNRNEGKRHMPFADATAKADYDSYSAHAGIGLGHTLHFSEAVSFVPSVRADYTWIGDESYKEKGAGALNLDVDSRDVEELIFSVDGKLNYSVTEATVLSANLGAGYDAINETSAISSAYAGAPGGVFTTRGLDPSPWLGRAGLGLSHTLDNGTEVSLRYDAESRSDYLNQGASIKARWAF